MRRLTRLPITVVNTHAHYERFFGNDVFVAMGVEDFWAHPRTVRAIEKYGESQRPYGETLEPEMAHHQGPATDIIVPNKLTAHNGEGITFTPVELGERSATLIYLGQGHTKGDLLVGVEDVLFAGGLLEQGTDPSFDDSYPDRWVETIGALTELDRYSIYVPGRGEPVDRDFVVRARDTMEAAIKAIRTSAIDQNNPSTTASMFQLPYSPGTTRILLDRLAFLDGGSDAAAQPDVSGFTGPITIGKAHSGQR